MTMNPTNPEMGKTSTSPHSVEKSAARKSSTSSTNLSSRGGNIVIHQPAPPRPAKYSFSSGSSCGSSGPASSPEPTQASPRSNPAKVASVPDSDSDSSSGWQLVQHHRTPKKPTTLNLYTPPIPKTPTSLVPVSTTPTTPGSRNRGCYNFHHHHRRSSLQSDQPQPHAPACNRGRSTSTPHPSYSSDNWRSPQRLPPFSPSAVATASPVTANRTLFLFLPEPPSPAGVAPRSRRETRSKNWRSQLPPSHTCYAQPAFVRGPDPRDPRVRFKVPVFFYRIMGGGDSEVGARGSEMIGEEGKEGKKK